jgi:hypothetical protein
VNSEERLISTMVRKKYKHYTYVCTWQLLANRSALALLALRWLIDYALRYTVNRNMHPKKFESSSGVPTFIHRRTTRSENCHHRDPSIYNSKEQYLLVFSDFSYIRNPLPTFLFLVYKPLVPHHLLHSSPAILLG